MHSIEHQLLTETDDAIGAIFLEEPKRRHLQAIAGLPCASRYIYRIRVSPILKQLGR